MAAVVRCVCRVKCSHGLLLLLVLLTPDRAPSPLAQERGMLGGSPVQLLQCCRSSSSSSTGVWQQGLWWQQHTLAPAPSARCIRWPVARPDTAAHVSIQVSSVSRRY